MSDSNNFLSRRQLCRRWNCSISTIKRKEARKELKPIRIGPRLVRYRLSDILNVESPE